MVRSSDGDSLAVPPFLKKCYEMVDDESTNLIISWGSGNDSFIIWEITEFSVQLLPKYFKHSNVSSFIRQLNIYGFRKIDTDNWEFSNDGFIRGQKHLLKNIVRRKNAQGADNRKSLQQQEDTAENREKVDNLAIQEAVENLKKDKNAVMQELVKLRRNQETADNNLILLRERMQGMEKNQQQMLSFLVTAMQNPGFLRQLLPKKENNWRMAEPGSIVEQDDTEPLASDAMIVRYQRPVDQMPEPAHSPPPVSENPQESNPSSDGMKEFFMDTDFIKLLADENLSSFENHPPFFLPELGDDGAWAQLLLDSPFSENIEETEKDKEKLPDAENEVKTAAHGIQWDDSQNFDFLTEETARSQNTENKLTDFQALVERSQNVEVLTKQLGLLSSESKRKSHMQ